MTKEPCIWAPGALTIITLVIAVAIVIQECPAWGSSLAGDIHRTAPHLTHTEAAEWAELIKAATEEAGLEDPRWLAAMVMRESSFLASIADGHRTGALGEVGPLQIHGMALTYRPGCLTGRACWLRAGALWAAEVRRRCPGSTWRWTAAYGRRRCPSEDVARESRMGRRTWHWYQVLGGRREW